MPNTLSWRVAGATGLVALGMVSAADAASLRVSFKNEAQNTANGIGIFLTPVFAALHNGGFDTFNNNQVASASVESLAEDGAPGGLLADAAAHDAVAGQVAKAGVLAGTSGAFDGSGPPPLIETGETASVEIDATGIEGVGSGYLSFMSMILPSNDFFIGNADQNAYKIFDAAGNFADSGAGFIEFGVFYNSVYDAGTEVNSAVDAMGLLENAPFVVGSAQGPANTGPTEGGVIRNLASTSGLDLSNLLGTQAPAGLVDVVPTPGSLIGTFRVEQVAAPVPLPAALPMLLAGIGLFGMVRRRQAR